MVGWATERTLSLRAIRLAALTIVIALTVATGAVQAQVAALPQAHGIVLVRGASEGPAWAAVISLLEAAGLRVTVVETPLTSLEASAAETRRVLALQDGPTVLVGHAWGGTVVSEVGADPKISALVYLEAAAPEAGEAFATLAAKFPTQPPMQASLAGTKTNNTAWREKPSFYAVAKDNAAIAPELQRFYASRMKAKTIVLDGDDPAASHPREIAGLILEAAGMKPPACGAENDDGMAACAAPALPRSLAEGCKCTKTPLEDLTAP
jgi:pimeloyl-ACP methyl ester carboxylesterase